MDITDSGLNVACNHDELNVVEICARPVALCVDSTLVTLSRKRMRKCTLQWPPVIYSENGKEERETQSQRHMRSF